MSALDAVRAALEREEALVRTVEAWPEDRLDNDPLFSAARRICDVPEILTTGRLRSRVERFDAYRRWLILWMGPQGEVGALFRVIGLGREATLTVPAICRAADVHAWMRVERELGRARDATHHYPLKGE